MDAAAYKPLHDMATAAYTALMTENERKRVQLEDFKAWARSVACRTNGATSAVERAINAEALQRGGDPDG
jgi:hypothetical protein